ncbi:hypothetical protein HNQ80_001567 [Anaerosolibacter carboniphilus]|uniref:Uncharacterized protein n=1 Tax=Anaerosolibacter carboniphilus TaxID=1417629 RepID=A0A841KTI8_9FIRM|nr:hypothetical protein [Anaerosolibacter carboniphilus]
METLPSTNIKLLQLEYIKTVLKYPIRSFITQNNLRYDSQNHTTRSVDFSRIID